MNNKINDMDYKSFCNLCFEQSDNLFLILSEDYIINDLNPEAEKILGWEKTNVLNKNINDLFHETSIQPFINPDKSNCPDNNITYIFNKKNQNLKIEWIITLIPGTLDKKVHIVIMGKKIPEITYEQLEILQLENAVKYAPGFFYWKDINSVYQGCNDEFARMAGLVSRTQVKGKTDFDLIWKESAEHYVEVDKEVIKTGIAKLNHVEVIPISSNKVITAITNKVPMRDNNGDIIGILGITTDITYQKEIEHALSVAKDLAEVANRAKTEFIANMSHDIRTPLTGVVGMSKIMENITNDPEEKQYARWINESGEQLLSLLNGILDVISADNVNDSDLVQESFDLKLCIQDIAQLELPTIKLKNLELELDIPDEIPKYLVSDRTKLHRIILNLLGNSIKFTQRGHVGISVQLLERMDDSVRLRFNISDTGIGIPEELQSKVFDRYFRVNPSYKGIYKGHGIGLHIAQSYVELLGGEIKLTSKVNHGTTFYFDLLLKTGSEVETGQLDGTVTSHNKEASPPQNIKLPRRSVVTDQNSPHLLLVEDNPIARHLIELISTDAGYRYTSAENAELAFRLVQSKNFDLIITDIGLPDMSGTELAQTIRDWERETNHSPIPIIGLTAHTGKSEEKKCLQAGINKIIIKPASLKVIQDSVKKLIPHKGVILTPKDPEPKTLKAKFEADLPETEEGLFQLDQFPLLDVENGLSILGNEQTLREILTLMLNEGIDSDRLLIEQSHEQQDWDTIEALVHKMKGAAAYCGTVKMHRACQYLERSRKAGHHQVLEQLYTQFLNVLDETKHFLTVWLNQTR